MQRDWNRHDRIKQYYIYIRVRIFFYYYHVFIRETSDAHQRTADDPHEKYAAQNPNPTEPTAECRLPTAGRRGINECVVDRRWGASTEQQRK